MVDLMFAKYISLSNAVTKLLLVYFAIVNSFPAFSKINYQMSFAVAEMPLRQAEPIDVKLAINFDEVREEACFYLPYNDPAFFTDPTQSFLGRSHQTSDEQYKPVDGMIALNDLTDTQFLSPSLVRIRRTSSSQQWNLPFRFITPRWPDRIGNQYLFSSFYPKLLKRCPDPTDLSHQFEIENEISIEANIVWPRDWYFATPAIEKERGHFFSSHGDFSFNLSKNYRILNTTVHGLPVTFVYLSDSFIRLKDYTSEFYDKASSWFGDFPFQKLVIVESEELEQPRVPGIITLNKPKQGGMKVIQDRYLNWMLWQYAEMLCEQWLGAYLRSESFDNFWFHRGTRSFVVNQILSSTNDAYDIFREPVKSWFTFNHSQMHDVIAAVKLNKNLESKLVDYQYETVESFYNQNHFLYLRHLMAMRYLFWLYEKDFQENVKIFFQNHKRRDLDHRDFLSFLSKKKSLSKNGFKAGEVLSLWWQSNEWPDFSLLRYEMVDQKVNKKEPLRLEVEVGFYKPYIIPVDLVFTFDDGSKTTQKIYPTKTPEVFTFEISKRPKMIQLNPNREIIDQDRYDNSSEWTDIVFFPGNAKTIRDDAYSVVWGMYPAQLPGEGVSINTRLNLFRYIQSGITGTVKYIPSEKNLGMDFRYFTDVEALGSNISLSYIDNYGQRYKDSRYFSLDIGRDQKIGENQNIDFHIRLNAIRDRNMQERNHVANGIQLKYSRFFQNTARLSLGFSHDRNLGISKNFSYKRNTFLFEYGYFSNGLSFGTRAFIGALDRNLLKDKVDVPDSVKFRPQSIQEARIRISSPSLDPVQYISSLNLDLYIPAYLPLPSSFFILPRKAKWRLFYDFGTTRLPDSVLSAAGVGVVLPIGGDIVGKKSLSFMQFSMLVLGYRRIDDEIIHDPSVIFGFSGNI